MKRIVSILLALGGLAAGVAAGLALRPAEEPAVAAELSCEGENCPEPAAAPAAEAVDQGSEIVAMDKPFVAPVFENERLVAMVVISLAVDVAAGQGGAIETLAPRLRDGLLAVMFRHANSGGFDGSFTQGEKIADLKAGLLAAAREVLAGVRVNEVLVTEIVRQDV